MMLAACIAVLLTKRQGSNKICKEKIYMGVYASISINGYVMYVYLKYLFTLCFYTELIEIPPEFIFEEYVIKGDEQQLE